MNVTVRWGKARRRCCVVALCFVAGCSLPRDTHLDLARGESLPRVQKSFVAERARVPRHRGFEPNRGQWPEPVRFAVRDGALTLFLTPTEAIWRFDGADPNGVVRPSVLRQRWSGADSAVEIAGLEPTGARVHRFHGRDPSGWRSDLPLFGRVVYRNLYPGIDLVFHDEHGSIQYDFVVAPGTDAGRIRLAFDGTPQVRIDEQGDLRFGVATEIVHRAPIVYQQVAASRHPVAGRYVIDANGGAPHPVHVAFAVDEYDGDLPLVIDPSVTYTASIVDDGSYSVTEMTADADGNVWLTGSTTSHTFPFTDDAFDKTFVANEFDEGYVMKLNAAGEIVYATYLGGSLFDGAGGIAQDEDGNVFIAGTTISTDFPVTPGAYQPFLAMPGTEDAFLVKLDSTGQLLESTYFGGNGRDLYPGGSRGFPGAAVALASDGSVYLASGTHSTDLPANNGYQQQLGGGAQDAFLAKFDSTLAFERCTYFGGDNNEGAYRVAVDGSDNVFLLGAAARIFGTNWTFPVTPGAYLTNPSGDPLLFVAKFDAGGDLAYATFLGPDAGDPTLFESQGDLAVDEAGNAYVVGVTTSAAFPVTPGALQTERSGFSDLFISKLDPGGSNLVYSTYYGGSRAEYANGDAGVRITVNEHGNAYVVGHTDSLDLPLVDSFHDTPSGRFIAKLNSAGTGLLYASYFLFESLNIDAIALVEAGGGPGGAGTGASVIAYVAGPNSGPRGVAVAGIEETGGPEPCPADCDGDGVVRAHDLVAGVLIAVEQADVSTCPRFDDNDDGRVDELELTQAIGSMFRVCS